PPSPAPGGEAVASADSIDPMTFLGSLGCADRTPRRSAAPPERIPLIGYLSPHSFGNRPCCPDILRLLRYHERVLDEKDLAILTALQADARSTFADIGKQAGLAPSSVHERVRKLELAGVIRSYRAELDAEALGLSVTALVSATPFDARQPDDLAERLTEFPEVEDCH